MSENIRLIINKVNKAEGGAPLRAFSNTQSNLGRFRFIDQVPGARDALINTLKKYKVEIPDFSKASQANSLPKK